MLHRVNKLKEYLKPYVESRILNGFNRSTNLPKLQEKEKVDERRARINHIFGYGLLRKIGSMASVRGSKLGSFNKGRISRKMSKDNQFSSKRLKEMYSKRLKEESSITLIPLLDNYIKVNRRAKSAHLMITDDSYPLPGLFDEKDIKYLGLELQQRSKSVRNRRIIRRVVDTIKIKNDQNEECSERVLPLPLSTKNNRQLFKRTTIEVLGFSSAKTPDSRTKSSFFKGDDSVGNSPKTPITPQLKTNEKNEITQSFKKSTFEMPISKNEIKSEQVTSDAKSREKKKGRKKIARSSTINLKFLPKFLICGSENEELNEHVASFTKKMVKRAAFKHRSGFLLTTAPLMDISDTPKGDTRIKSNFSSTINQDKDNNQEATNKSSSNKKVIGNDNLSNAKRIKNILRLQQNTFADKILDQELAPDTCLKHERDLHKIPLNKTIGNTLSLNSLNMTMDRHKSINNKKRTNVNYSSPVSPQIPKLPQLFHNRKLEESITSGSLEYTTQNSSEYIIKEFRSPQSQPISPVPWSPIATPILPIDIYISENNISGDNINKKPPPKYNKKYKSKRIKIGNKGKYIYNKRYTGDYLLPANSQTTLRPKPIVHQMLRRNKGHQSSYNFPLQSESKTILRPPKGGVWNNNLDIYCDNGYKNYNPKSKTLIGAI